MLAAVLITLAAIFKAVADTLAHHYGSSIFKKLNYKFWEPEASWLYVKKIFSYPVDAWHIANSLMIVSFLSAIAINDLSYAWYWQVIGGGALFNLVFNIFYNRILR